MFFFFLLFHKFPNLPPPLPRFFEVSDYYSARIKYLYAKILRRNFIRFTSFLPPSQAEPCSGIERIPTPTLVADSQKATCFFNNGTTLLRYTQTGNVIVGGREEGFSTLLGKEQSNIDIYRGVIETFSLFWDREESVVEIDVNVDWGGGGRVC